MKKIINILISDFYKVEIFRTLICILGLYTLLYKKEYLFLHKSRKEN